MKKFVFTLAVFTLGFVQHTSVVLAQQSSPTMLENIRAFVEIDEQLATSGQMSYEQIPLIKEAGYEVVINLAPADEERNGREGFLVTREEMTYVQIPVSWEAPAERDLQLFFDVMQANRDRKVYVHCFANMRASAFVYLYRTLKAGTPEATARADMAKVWDPATREQWQTFIDQAKSKADQGR